MIGGYRYTIGNGYIGLLPVMRLATRQTVKFTVCKNGITPTSDAAGYEWKGAGLILAVAFEMRAVNR